jgi:hypothetical protein
LIVAFGVIGSASRAHAKHGAIARFRRGMVIDYPTDAANRAGSCIFINTRRRIQPVAPLDASICRKTGLQPCRNSRKSILLCLPKYLKISA